MIHVRYVSHRLFHLYRPLCPCCHLHTWKLKEENERIRAARASKIDEKQEASTRESMSDDDVGSNGTELKRGHASCGTRDMEHW